MPIFWKKTGMLLIVVALLSGCAIGQISSSSSAQSNSQVVPSSPIDNSSASDQQLEEVISRLYLTISDEEDLTQQLDQALDESQLEATYEPDQIVRLYTWQYDYMDGYDRLGETPGMTAEELLYWNPQDRDGVCYLTTGASGDDQKGEVVFTLLQQGKSSAGFLSSEEGGVLNSLTADGPLGAALRASDLSLADTVPYLVGFYSPLYEREFVVLLCDGTKSYVYVPYDLCYSSKGHFYQELPTPVVMAGQALYPTGDFFAAMGLYFGNTGGHSVYLSYESPILGEKAPSQQAKDRAYLYEQQVNCLANFVGLKNPQCTFLSYGMSLTDEGFYLLSSAGLAPGHQEPVGDGWNLYLHEIRSDGYQMEIRQMAQFSGQDTDRQASYCIGWAQMTTGPVLFGRVLNGADANGENPKRFDTLTVEGTDGSSWSYSLYGKSYFIFQLPINAQPQTYCFTDFTGDVVAQGELNGREVPLSEEVLYSTEEIGSALLENYQAQYSESEFTLHQLAAQGVYRFDLNGQEYKTETLWENALLLDWLMGYRPLSSEESPTAEFSSDFTIISPDGTVLEFDKTNYKEQEQYPDNYPHYRRFVMRIGEESYYYAYDHPELLSVVEVLERLGSSL